MFSFVFISFECFLFQAHDPDHVKRVLRICPFNEQDTFVCKKTPYASRLAVGSVLKLIDAIMDAKTSVVRGFATVRPPGHHASREMSSGFCIFNNVAVAAEYLK